MRRSRFSEDQIIVVLKEHEASLAEARRIIENWRIDHNTLRPHTSLGGLAPSVFASRSDLDQITAGPNL